MRRPNGNDLGTALILAWCPLYPLLHPRETAWTWRHGGDRRLRYGAHVPRGRW